MSDGVVDTNVFMHALTRDQHSGECRAFLECLRQGALHVRLEPYVVHELTYALPRLEKQWTKERVAELLLMILDLPGIDCDRPLMKTAISRWLTRPGVSFVDALLWAQALGDGSSIFTINDKDFQGADVPVPRPMPACER